jgi:hypothetical protein
VKAGFGFDARENDLKIHMVDFNESAAIRFFTGNGSASTERMRVAYNGNVGIGTSTPQQKLHVSGISRFDVGGGSFSFSTPGGWPGIIAYSPNGHRRDIQSYDDRLTIATSPSSDPSDPANGIVLMENGNIGIGTSSPTRKLTVRGNLLLQSAATGQAVAELGEGLDYAEGFHLSGLRSPEPGSVLVIDPENPGKLKLSEKAYDTRVAGIVAGADGLKSGVRLGVGGHDCDVALAGRVYCNVVAGEGAVEPGDLLTTADLAGYAMKADDLVQAQGAVLGKAMERLASGLKGRILVLVTLQ